MTYTVLARRYRSQGFDEIVGQEPIARTLQNAIESNRIAHAYLFCGTRGVGKTSMARIFAKAMNVTSDLAQADEIAASILRGDDLDVIEIDGASNRGINEAKDLIAGAGLSPARCPYKIYIIDEVHMLTREAFNALLKTMEEPPQHVKFILCTTESHKVPATIQSRCQRFDFRPIATPQIAAHLQSILESEGVTGDEAVVLHVARLGHGSMRDALSLLDRLLATGERTLGFELLEQMLGLPDQTLITDIVDAIATGDAGETLARADRLLATGLAEDAALDLLADRFRSLLVLAACGNDSSLLELPPDALEVAAAQAAHFDPPGLVHLIAICDAVARNIRSSSIGRALFDAAIVRMAAAEHLADVAALLAGEVEATPRVVEAKKKPRPDRADPVSPRSSPEGAGVAVRPDDAAPQIVETKPAPPAPPATREADDSADLDGPALWACVVAKASRSPSDQAKIDHLRFGSLDGSTIRLEIEPDGAPVARWLCKQAEWLGQLIHRATGRRLRVEVDASSLEPRDAAQADAGDVEAARKIPAVREAMDLFDAIVTEVQAIGAEPPGRRSDDDA